VRAGSLTPAHTLVDINSVKREMILFPKPRFKVCCITSIEEAQLAIRYGASAIGLVSSMPSGPGVIPEWLIREIAISVPPGVATFLLTSQQDVKAIIAQQRHCSVNTIQLCDRLSADSLAELREALPGISLVPVIHILDAEALHEAQVAARVAHALLLDSGNPEKPVKELGGTGRIHDWSISRCIREAVAVPVFLAGGLSPQNIGEAIRQVHPYSVDVCSGLRTDGQLNEAKLEVFVSNLESAWRRQNNAGT